jgi:hypothetical protein
MVYILHDDGSISAFFHTQSLNGMQKGDEVYAGRVGISNGSGKGRSRTHYSYFPPARRLTREPVCRCVAATIMIRTLRANSNGHAR